jgi:hypothetical protein
MWPICRTVGSRDSSVSTVTGPRAGRTGNLNLIPIRSTDFVLKHNSKRFAYSQKFPGRLWGPHNLLAQVVSFHGGKGGRGHLVARLRVTGAKPLLPHTFMWRARRSCLLLDPDRLWAPPKTGAADCCPGIKAAGTRSWQLAPIYYRGLYTQDDTSRLGLHADFLISHPAYFMLPTFQTNHNLLCQSNPM